jgi:cell division protein FtsL
MKIPVVCMALIAFVVVGLGVGHVSRRQEVIRLGYELSEASSELRALQEENRKLRLERSVLTNPERIRALAESLEMTQPTEGQVRVVRPDAAELAGLAPEPASP